MGGSSNKPALTDSDKEYIGEHTSVTKDEVMKYENFLQEHPDGQITPQDFR